MSIEKRFDIPFISALALREKQILIETACRLLKDGAPAVSGNKIHRLDKADTKTGVNGVQVRAGLGVPYAMLLYERLLGRPFAGHRDSVSELIGASVKPATCRPLRR